MRRIHVVGTSCSGKTTLARALAARLGLPHVELDALHWAPGWTEVPRELMQERVAQATAGDGWVIDGNYSRVRDDVWTRADTVVWLNYALPVILARYARRTARRMITREELWGTGNRERPWLLLSREGLLYWILTTYKKRRREYPALFAERPDLNAVILESPRAAERWLASIA